MRRKSRVMSCIAGTIALIVTVWVYVRAHTEPELLARSRAVYTLPRNSITWGWISPDDVAIVRLTKPSWMVQRINLGTGMVTAVSEIGSPNGPLTVYDFPKLSPDGRHILQHKWPFGSRSQVDVDHVAVYDLDGKPVHSWRVLDLSTTTAPVWLADSSHWLESVTDVLRGGFYLIQHGPLDADKQLGGPEEFGTILGQDTYGRLILYQALQTIDIKHKLEAYDLATGTLLHTSVIPIPGQPIVSGITLSANRNLVAFVCYTGGDYVYPEWIRKHVRFLSGQRTVQKESLWVCGIDGNGLRELGVIPRNEERLLSEGMNPMWVIGGKSISFTYNGRVWVTPVD